MTFSEVEQIMSEALEKGWKRTSLLPGTSFRLKKLGYELRARLTEDLTYEVFMWWPGGYESVYDDVEDWRHWSMWSDAYPMKDTLRNVPITALEGDLPDFRRYLIDEIGHGPRRAVLYQGKSYWVVAGYYGNASWYPRGFTVDLENVLVGEPDDWDE